MGVTLPNHKNDSEYRNPDILPYKYFGPLGGKKVRQVRVGFKIFKLGFQGLSFRVLSSSFFWFIFEGNPKKEPQWSLWVSPKP